jgi:hypothetical protein
LGLLSSSGLIVAADEDANPHDLQVNLWVNGMLKQGFHRQEHGQQDPALHRVGVGGPSGAIG